MKNKQQFYSELANLKDDLGSSCCVGCGCYYACMLNTNEKKPGDFRLHFFHDCERSSIFSFDFEYSSPKYLQSLLDKCVLNGARISKSIKESVIAENNDGFTKSFSFPHGLLDSCSFTASLASKTNHNTRIYLHSIPSVNRTKNAHGQIVLKEFILESYSLCRTAYSLLMSVEGNTETHDYFVFCLAEGAIYFEYGLLVGKNQCHHDHHAFVKFGIQYNQVEPPNGFSVALNSPVNSYFTLVRKNLANFFQYMTEIR